MTFGLSGLRINCQGCQGWLLNPDRKVRSPGLQVSGLSGIAGIKQNAGNKNTHHCGRWRFGGRARGHVLTQLPISTLTTLTTLTDIDNVYSFCCQGWFLNPDTTLTDNKTDRAYLPPQTRSVGWVLPSISTQHQTVRTTMPNQPNSERAVLTCEFINRSELFGLWQRGQKGDAQANHIVLNIHAVDLAAEKPGDRKAACVVCADPNHYRLGAPNIFVVLSRQDTDGLVAIASICRKCVSMHPGEALLPAVAAGFEKNAFEPGSTLQIVRDEDGGRA